MSTRCRIGFVKDNGEVASIYCHNDGYPAYMGNMLLEHYMYDKKIKDLIDLGDISFLAENVDVPEGAKHTFSNPLGNVTIAYHRDRGEHKIEPRLNKSEKEFWESDFEEYGYIYKEGKWYFSTTHGTLLENQDKRQVYELNEENISKGDSLFAF